MIIREEFQQNGQRFVKTYSDLSVQLKNQDGDLFNEAIDPIEFKDNRTYAETDIAISVPELDPSIIERFHL